MNNIPIYFILGIGRSGTTLLQSMLSMHPHICAPIESKLIVNLQKKYARINSWNNAIINDFLNNLYNDHKFSTYWKIDRNYLENKIKNYNEEINFKSLVKLVYTSFKYFPEEEKENIKIIIDKNPEYIHFTDKIINIFPESKFIHLYRDFRDNVYSVKRLTEIKKTEFLIENWLQGNLLVEKYKQKYPDKFFTVKYEDLVGRKNEIMKDLLHFLGLAYTDAVFDFNRKAAEADKKQLEASNHFHKELLKPVNTDNIGKWKKGLSEKEVNYINYRVHSYAYKLGYNAPYQFKVYYLWKKIISFIRYRINMSIVRGYFFYYPVWFRKTLSYISLKLYQWFKYSNYFNYERFRFIKDKQSL